MKQSGIYKIQSIIKSDKIYIGSAVHISNRWNWHLKDLRNNKHGNKKLQNHYNKYGESDLQFSILLGCEKEDLVKIEQYFIDSYNPFFNICKIAGSRLGVKCSNETKEKMSISKKGIKLSPCTDEHRKNLSISLKGKKRKPYTEEYKKVLSNRMKGKPSRNKGYKLSEESKNLISKKMKDRFVSEKTREKMSKVQKGKIISIETKEKIRQANIGKKQSEETKDKKRKSMNDFYLSKKLV